jgi:competence protein ComEC
MFFKGEIPFVRLLIPLILGIGLSLFWPYQVVSRLGSSVLTFAMILFCALVLFYKNHHIYRNKWLLGILVHFIFLLAAYNHTYHYSQKFNADYFAKVRSDALIVTVSNEPQLFGEILKFESRVEKAVSLNTITATSGKLLVALKNDEKHPFALNFGDRLIIPSRYNEIEPPYNPGEFNYKEYLGTRQLYHQVFLNQQEIRIIHHQAGDQTLSFAIALRKTLVEKFYRYLPDKEAAALASTLILGYRANLSKEVISAYSKTGTMHVLSVSGMHVGIIFIVLNFLIRPLRRFKNMRYASALIIIVLIWFYALITGFSPSVCRAAMMLSFVVLGKALSKNLNTYNLLAISAFFLLLYNPYYLLDVGFQLSYFAVLGLVYLHPKIYGLLYIKNKLVDSIWSYSALSFAAQLATFPLSIYYFHQFPLYFLLSNLVIVLPVALIMYAGIIFLFIPWPGTLEPLGLFLSKLISFTDQILYYIEDMPVASIGGIWINTYQYILIYLLIGSIIWAALAHQKMAVYLAMACLFIFSLSLSLKSIINGQTRELIFYSLRRNSAMAFIKDTEAYLVSDLLQDTKTLSYSITPAIEMQGASILKKLSSTDTFNNDLVKINPQYMQFGHLKVFRWDQRLNNLTFTSRARADIVLLTGSPKITIQQIRNQISFSLLLIDSNNADYLIDKWRSEAEKLKVNFRVLKKEPAYVYAF